MSTGIQKSVFSDMVNKNNAKSFKIGDEVYYKDTGDVSRGIITDIDVGKNTCKIGDNKTDFSLNNVVPYFADREEVEIYDNDMNNWIPGKINKFVMKSQDDKTAGIGYYTVIVDFKRKSAQLEIHPALIRKKGDTITTSTSTSPSSASSSPSTSTSPSSASSSASSSPSTSTSPSTVPGPSSPPISSSSSSSPAAAVPGPLVPSGTTITFNVSSGNKYSGTIKKGSDEVEFTGLIINDNGTSDLKGVTFPPKLKSSGGYKKYYLNKTKRKRYLGKNGKSRRIIRLRI
jgi:hypothetical protein